MLDANVRVDEEERVIYANLVLQYAWDFIKLQASYRVQYKEDYNYQSLQTRTFISEDKSALAKTYISKNPIGHILIVCQDIQQECKRLNILLIAAHRYDKVLDRELATLVEEEKYC